MVLFGTKLLGGASGLFRGTEKGDLEVLSFWTLQNIFFDLCKDCRVKMSSFPPSMFTAGRTRDTLKDRDTKLPSPSKGRGTEPNKKFFDTSFMELTPLKYNSKLMNSIWGFYNRYSPHNVKKISFEMEIVECQQSAGNSTNKGTPTKLDNIWTVINLSQSQ